MSNEEYFSENELFKKGITFGSNVFVHRSVIFFGNNVELGHDVRIDCFSLITSDEKVKIGNNVHLAPGVYIFGTAGVEIGSYCGISSRCVIYSTSDDYSGGYMTNPTLPNEFRNVKAAAVRLNKHVIIGSGSVIMPGVTINAGASIGALSYVNKNIPEYMIVSGNPLRKIGYRNKSKLKSLEESYEKQR